MRLRPYMEIWLAVQSNPFRHGSQASRMFNLYRGGMTVSQFIDEGRAAGFGRASLRQQIYDDLARGYITVSYLGQQFRSVAVWPLGQSNRRARRTTQQAVRDFVSTTSIPSGVNVSSDDGVPTFGVEIELLMPENMTRERLASLIGEAVSCRYEGYNHVTGRNWKVVTDGSLDYTRGAEVVSPILSGEDGFAQVERVCSVLVREGCMINRECGLHVHLNARGRDITFFQRLISLYAVNEAILDSIMPASRRGEHAGRGFCSSVRPYREAVNNARTISQAQSAMGNGPTRRYRKVNLEAFSRHGTVEFRHHSGTVEAEKILRWTRVCMRMYATAASSDPLPMASNIGELLVAIGCKDDDVNFYRARAAHFSSRQNEAAA